MMAEEQDKDEKYTVEKDKYFLVRIPDNLLALKEVAIQFNPPL